MTDFTRVLLTDKVAWELFGLASREHMLYTSGAGDNPPMSAVTVAAQTLPEENASTSVLQKLRFRLVGSVEHSEDGLVWEWQLSDTSEA
jgi:hypothetical protein